MNFQFDMTRIGFQVISVHYGSQSCNFKPFVTISEKRSLSHETHIRFKVIEGTEIKYKVISGCVNSAEGPGRDVGSRNLVSE